MADQIQTVIDALKGTIATPNSTGPGSDPAVWKGGTATPGTVLQPVATLMGALYSASGDMKSVGTSISRALAEVATVIRAIADQMATLGAIADAANAMQQLQQAMQLAQTLAPTGPVVVLNSAGTLFGQIQQLLAAGPAQGATELYQLAQQLDLIGAKLSPVS